MIRVQAYWNVRKKLWSIRHKGKVIAHEGILPLFDCKFVVQPAGRERVRKTKVKNVHAWVDGYTMPLPNAGCELDLHGGTRVSYNPHNDDTFVVRDTNTPVFKADRVFLSSTFNPNDGKRPFVVIPRDGAEATIHTAQSAQVRQSP